jgi:hypothetical protein
MRTEGCTKHQVYAFIYIILTKSCKYMIYKSGMYVCMYLRIYVLYSSESYLLGITRKSGITGIYGVRV